MSIEGLDIESKIRDLVISELSRLREEIDEILQEFLLTSIEGIEDEISVEDALYIARNTIFFGDGNKFWYKW